MDKFISVLLSKSRTSVYASILLSFNGRNIENPFSPPSSIANHQLSFMTEVSQKRYPPLFLKPFFIIYLFPSFSVPLFRFFSTISRLNQTTQRISNISFCDGGCWWLFLLLPAPLPTYYAKFLLFLFLLIFLRLLHPF